jgi:5-methylcytosine-specific restriction endonuclease McrA
MHIFGKTDGRCLVCGKHLAFDNRTLGQWGAWHLGHLVARAHGGSDNPRNLVPICAECNLKIGALGVRYYIERYMRPANFWEWVKDQFGAEVVRRIKRD